MQKFKYETRDDSGHVEAGVIQADSLTDASNLLRNQGGYLMNIAPLAQGKQNILARMQSVTIEFGPGLKDVHNFTNQLAVMLKAGINIRSAIGAIADQVENLKFRKIIMHIKADVEAGQPFSKSLAKHPRVFSPLYVNMVRASELSGNLGHMLERIAEYLSQQVETRNMVRGAMVYPTIIAVMAIATTTFLLTFVLPKFTTLFAGKDALLPKPTLILMAISDYLRNYWYTIVGGVVIVGVAFYYAIQTPTGKLYWDKFKLHIPLLKRMFRALYITRGLHTMGELINAGVPVLDTLAITADVSGNLVYKRMWRLVYESVEEGNKIAQPLERQRLLPQHVVQMVAAGEESGKLGEVLRDVAEYYAKELRNTIKIVTAMIEPLMIVLM
ncbi:MAG: type II secretion system F family protein, partial [Phycisphaerae bacterium]|nr:type II secretion system F family protein [Phycisphaerae bacterium]